MTMLGSHKGAQRLTDMYFSPIRAVGERSSLLAEQGHPVISFSSGEPDFDTPYRIKEATIKAIQQNKTHYAPNRGALVLRQEIAAQLKRVNDLEYDPANEILVTSGGAEAINNSFLAVLNPGDEVIIFTPAFMNYENLISMCGAIPVKIPLKSEHGFQIDVDELKAHVNDNTKMIVVNNPCNPTGVVTERAILERIAQIAAQYNLLVFSDEIYNQIIYEDTKCISIASIQGMRNRVITMNGFSKAYAMTGWRLAYVAAEKQILSDILKIHQYTTTCSPTFIQIGVAEAMNSEETLAEIIKMRDVFDRRRRLLMGGLDKIGRLKYTIPKGAFYIFVDVSETGMDGDEFASRLLEEHYVACIPGSKLGEHCKNFIRISYATNDEAIKQGLERINSFLNR